MKILKRDKKYIASDWKEKIEKAIKNSLTMTEAYKKLGLERKTFKRMAEELGLYKPNPGRKGSTRKACFEYDIKDILANKLPCESHKLKLKLLKYHYKKYECEMCHNEEWMGRPIPLELHHKNGDKKDNSLKNLLLLCPNCHYFTDNYRARKLKNKKYC